MTDKHSMEASEIVHIVPTESHHYLYLKSGLVVQFNPTTGTIGRVVSLPSMADVQGKLGAPPTRGTIRGGTFSP